MGEHFHVLVWIDHQLAKVISFNTDNADSSIVHSTHGKQHLHHKVNAGDSGHVAVDSEYLERVALALKNAGVKDVRMYFGSWNEWSRDPSLPIDEGLPTAARLTGKAA
jgi:hypothetical protein